MRQSVRRRRFGILAATLLGSGIAFSQPPGSALFGQLDRDRDGRVSTAEASEPGWFADADRDADGFVTATELRGALNRWRNADRDAGPAQVSGAGQWPANLQPGQAPRGPAFPPGPWLPGPQPGQAFQGSADGGQRVPLAAPGLGDRRFAGTLPRGAFGGPYPRRSGGVPWGRQRQPPDTQAVAPAPPAEELPEHLCSQPIRAGVVLDHGRYLAPPYTIEWRDRSLWINDSRIDTVTWLEPPEIAKLDADALREVSDGLELQLRTQFLFLLGDGNALRSFPPLQAAELLDILLAGGNTADTVDVLLREFGPQIASREWTGLLQVFEPSEALRERAGEIRAFLRRGQGNPRLMQALTVAAMALVAIAGGLLLRGRAAAAATWRGMDSNPAVLRQVVLWTLLLLVLNAFDLVATLSAAACGGFAEMNPLAGGLLASPLGTAAYKIALAGAGAALLLLFRR
ncbi:MAG: hypothetical protein JXR77_13230, partial [Lentisphaeria bacterium]|nr:hypothetical protein [Lentisphaeria bacterium]